MDFWAHDTGLHVLYNNLGGDDDDTQGSASPLSSELQVDKGLDTDQGVSTVVSSKGELDKHVINQSCLPQLELQLHVSSNVPGVFTA